MQERKQKDDLFVEMRDRMMKQRLSALFSLLPEGIPLLLLGGMIVCGMLIFFLLPGARWSCCALGSARKGWWLADCPATQD